MQCCSKLVCSVCTSNPGQFDNSIATFLAPGCGFFTTQDGKGWVGVGWGDAGGTFQFHWVFLERWRGPQNDINNVLMLVSFSTI